MKKPLHLRKGCSGYDGQVMLGCTQPNLRGYVAATEAAMKKRPPVKPEGRLVVVRDLEKRGQPNKLSLAPFLS